MKFPLIATLVAVALTSSGCASYLKRIETATGPDAYWINDVPEAEAKSYAEYQKNAFYNQPAMKAYLTAASLLPVALFGAAAALPTYVPPVVP